MAKIVKVTDPQVLGMDEPAGIDDSVPFRHVPRTDQELVDHDLGIEAVLAGRRNDNTKSKAWQHGWAQAQKNRRA